MTASAEVVLLGDIGATNARFALLVDGVLGPVAWVEVARYPQFADAVKDFLQGQAGKTVVTHALFAVAGPVETQRVVMSNCPWIIDGREIRHQFDLKTARIVNDFEATALSLPHLQEQDLQSLGGWRAAPGAPMAVLRPGSGLGVAGLLSVSSGTTVDASEGGYGTLAATRSSKNAVLAYLREPFGHASAERALSGPGLENLYGAIAALDGIDAPVRNAAEITNAALKGTCGV